MNFFRMVSGDLVNLDHIVLVGLPNTQFGKSNVRLMMTNNIILTISPEDWIVMEPLILSYTYYASQRNARIESGVGQPIQLDLPFDAPEEIK